MRVGRIISMMVIVVIASKSSLAHDDKAKPDPIEIARRIDDVLYSDLTKDEMLEKLKPLVAVMDSQDDFKKKTGLEFSSVSGSGPGVAHCTLSGCGLELVVDPDENIRIIRRAKKQVGGKRYRQMSVSEKGFVWNGYSRFYPD